MNLSSSPSRRNTNFVCIIIFIAHEEYHSILVKSVKFRKHFKFISSHSPLPSSPIGHMNTSKSQIFLLSSFISKTNYKTTAYYEKQSSTSFHSRLKSTKILSSLCRIHSTHTLSCVLRILAYYYRRIYAVHSLREILIRVHK